MWQGVRSGFLARIGMSAEVAVDGFVRRTSARHRTLRALACPACHSDVAVTDTGASCRGCQRVFPVVDGVIDFLPEPAAEPTEFSAHLFHQTLAVGSRYDQKMRTSFVRVLGRDADQAFSPEHEIDYVRGFIGSERPVLDLACGTGRLTSQMVAFVSPTELIGVDLSMRQLSACAKQPGMHGMLLAHGTALALPFGDESLGAVTLINALQQIPEPQRVLAEIGRCLRPRGRLVCTTYRSYTDGIGGYIRSTYARAFKIRSFAESEIDEWCRGAGMQLLDVRGPASVLMFAAMKGER
jgi:SAM-dependent methyltransferase